MMMKLDARRPLSRRLLAILSLRGEGRELSKSALWLFVALSLMNASNYLFHVIVSRELGPSSYGALTSLLAVLLVLSVPLNVLQTTVAKRAAVLRAEGRADELPELSRAAVRVILPVAFVGALLFVVGSPVMSAFLHVGAGSVAMLGGYAFLSLLLSVPLGVLQGSLRFRALAVVLAVGVGARLILGFALAHSGYGIGGALVATLLAPAISLVLAERALRPKNATSGETRWSLTLLRGDFRLTMLGLGSFWVLAAVDILLARHFLRTTAAGYYASADILARALLFLPGAVSTAAFPRFVQIARDPVAARRWLTVTVGAVVGLSLAGLPLLVLLRNWAISLAFGGRFAPAARFVPGLSVAMMFLAVANLLVYFHIAAGTRSHLVLFAGAAAEAVLIAIFHHSAGEVVGVVLGVSAGVTALLAHAAVVATRTAREFAPIRSAPQRSENVRVSLVLPCHNAGAGLGAVLESALAELEGAGRHQVIVVSDGSTDETVRIARTFADRGVQVIEYPDCAGKGHALRVGLSAARGDYVAFMDADGDISPEALRPFLTLMDLYRPDIILGSKRHPLSEIEYPFLRRILSWTYHKITRVLFRVNVRDTQTGMKLVRREVLLGVLPLMKEEGYAFDLEMLVVAKQLGFTRVFEAPIRIDYRFTSQMNLRTPIRIMSQTLAIFYRRYLLNTYAQPAAVALASGENVIPLPVSRVISPHDEDGPLRVLFLNWRDITNPEAGGAEVFTHEVAKRWVARGHEVTLLTSRFRGSRPSEVIDGVQMIRVGNLRRGTYHLRVQRELARLSGYDAIVDEVNTLPMLTPLWQDGLPPTLGLIHQLAEDVWDAEVSRPLALVGRMIEPRLLRMYRDVTMATVSGSTMADLDRLGLRDVRVVLEGRDDPPPVAHLEKEVAPTFAFVGRLAANKRPDHAIEAFRTIRKHLPSARLWMIGRGALESELRADAPEGVEFLGRLSRDELFGRMARAHCLLVPSVREGWGLVITEANGVGTPAVGYDAPGIRDAIRPGRTGLLAPAGDPRALGELAVQMLADAGRYEEMRRESRRWAGCFSWDATADLLMRLVRERVRPAPIVIREEVAVGAGLAAVE
jgi:glycosyltransferase involved in cell wall biosynthesis/O-antigen/teichoic acid export membrane protein